MYIDPFIAGILCVIGAELLCIVIGALISIWRDKRRNTKK